MWTMLLSAGVSIGDAAVYNPLFNVMYRSQRIPIVYNPLFTIMYRRAK